MIFTEIIKRKRDDFALSREEIVSAIRGYTDGEIPDYQMSAFLMAVLLKGMNKDETMYLTDAMLNTGRIFDLSKIPGRKIDKHSTGGVGDKVSLILAPLVASCGVAVPMVSGRGLGHTGGTLDKLESIPGFRTSLEYNEFYKILEKIGVAMMGQTDEIAPADKSIYSLRDVTGTVESIPLITASILSKKLAEGIDGLVLDVKCGKGGFMKELKDAEALATSITSVAKGFGKKCVSLITNMDQPLGNYVGNSLEVIESIECLKGNGPQDLMEVTLTIGREMLVMGEKARDRDEAMVMLDDAIKSGGALALFRKMIELQGGNPEVTDDYSILPFSKDKKEIKAQDSGWISEIDAYEIGVVNLLLGGGRRRKEDAINPGVGIVFEKKVGDRVKKNEPLATIYYDKVLDGEIEQRFSSSIKIFPKVIEKPPVILGSRRL
ncbi:MAG: thymidine phosphorylase [Candidatus Cloacimonadota bacterium]|nr:MAG: thymidine phosphorylase [Candidatus Cloacimonadota bacterium]